MKLIRKCKKNTGFSLSETLLATLILLMVSSVVAAGIPAARNAYEKVTIAANAQVLLSTAASTLRDELGTADRIESADFGTVSYLSARTGSISKIYCSEDGVIMLAEYIGFSDAGDGTGSEEPGSVRQLVSGKASTADLFVTYEAIKVTDARITVRGLCVKRRSDPEAVQTEPMNLVIRTAVRS